MVENKKQNSDDHKNGNDLLADVSKQRELLIAFASHLNTYKGMEEIRFDFMVVDFLEKQTLKNNTDSPIGYEPVLCGGFLKELATKHKVDIDKIMVGFMGKDLYVWRYDNGAYEVFKTLEIIELNAT